MADRAINSLPTKTAPTSGDKMLMIGAAEEYQIDYDQLATAILNKLSTQSFNSLDTTAKTILGGINELNAVQRNTEGYMFSASGEYGADCNDITQPGLCKKVVTPSDENSPGFYAYLFVFKYTGSEGEMVNLTQVAFPYNSNNAIKCRYRSAGVWSEWF